MFVSLNLQGYIDADHPGFLGVQVYLPSAARLAEKGALLDPAGTLSLLLTLRTLSLSLTLALPVTLTPSLNPSPNPNPTPNPAGSLSLLPVLLHGVTIAPLNPNPNPDPNPSPNPNPTPTRVLTLP